MRSIVAAALGLTLFAIPPAAGREPGPQGVEAGGGSVWAVTGTDPDAGASISLSRWRDARRWARIDTRLQYRHVPSWSTSDAIEMISIRHAAADVLTLDRGIDLHFPIVAGLTPFLGLRAGVGLAQVGSAVHPHLDRPAEITPRHVLVGLDTGLEIGLKLVAIRPWPGLRAAFTLQALGGHGGAIATGGLHLALSE